MRMSHMKMCKSSNLVSHLTTIILILLIIIVIVIIILLLLIVLVIIEIMQDRNREELQQVCHH